MERFSISKPLLEKLREIRAAQLRHEYPDQVIQREEAIYLTLGFGPAIYLCFDGRVLIWHYVEDEPIRETDEIKDIAGGIVIGAKNNDLPELLALLPPKPVDGFTCEMCKGQRWVTVRTTENEPHWFVCPTCSGLGWQTGSPT